MYPVSPSYRGRFAPSPTGPLHFGSLVTAVAGYLDARAAAGRWYVRMEDIDTPRVVPGAADQILTALEAFGLVWDGPVVYQSQRTAAYRDVFHRLRDAGHVYPCVCTRKDLAGAGRYPGTCAGGLPPGTQPRSWRLRVAPGPVPFHDRFLGPQSLDASALAGDFVVVRADGPFSYQFSVVVDDDAQRITHIVRGNDLLDATPGQVYLQRLLGLPQPAYLHVPVVRDATGAKLSKQTRAAPILPERASPLLRDAVAYLGLNPPAALDGAPPAEILQWAVAGWPSLCR